MLSTNRTRLSLVAAAICLAGLLLPGSAVAQMEFPELADNVFGFWLWNARVDASLIPSDQLCAGISVIQLPWDKTLSGKTEMIQIRSLVNQGADFALLAATRSCGPKSVNGGFMGYRPRGSFPKWLDDLAFSMQANQISHIITVGDRLYLIRHHGYTVWVPMATPIVTPKASTPQVTVAKAPEIKSPFFKFIDWLFGDDEEDTEPIEVALNRQLRGLDSPLQSLVGGTQLPTFGDSQYWNRELERITSMRNWETISGTTVTADPGGSCIYTEMGGGTAAYVPGQGVSFFSPM